MAVGATMSGLKPGLDGFGGTDIEKNNFFSERKWRNKVSRR
jgi:hypothetical protein